MAQVQNPELVVRAAEASASAGQFDIHTYLAEERGKDLLRFSTAGSVDDGKSTLIGRLLYDTQSVYDDQIRSIEGKGTTAPGVLDLALLTDGLRAEREQGITIDVAYRYFSTPRRKFIIADTPGHEQYTRNMATGASTADVAIVLVDARKGVLSQSRRHAYITALLGVRRIILAVNKMDLVDYSETVFNDICREFESFIRNLGVEGSADIHLHFIPVSALRGDNVVHRTDAMDWYSGPSLLDLLETLPSSQVNADSPFRFAVQRVIRPNLDFRGFAGQIASGTVRPGDSIIVLPSGRTSRVQRIVTFDGDLDEATAPLSVTLTLEDEIDISRGDLLTGADVSARVATSFAASLVWMGNAPLQTDRRYLLKHTSRTVQAYVRQLHSIVDLSDTLPRKQDATGEALAMNGVGEVSIEVLQPIAADPYATNRRTGSFVLLDPQSNATIAAGMIHTMEMGATATLGAITAAERATRFGHAAAHLHLTGPRRFAESLERALFERGAFVLLWQDESPAFAGQLLERGLLLLTHSETTDSISVEVIQEKGSEPSLRYFMVEEIDDAVRQTLDRLQQDGILRGGH